MTDGTGNPAKSRVHRDGASSTSSRPAPQCRQPQSLPNNRNNGRNGSDRKPSGPGRSSSSNQNSHQIPKVWPRPSTWPIFLVHFVLPAFLLLLVSNGDDMIGGFSSLISSQPTPFTRTAPTSQHSQGKGDEASRPSALPTTSSSSTSNTQYKNEIDAAIERKKRASASQAKPASSSQQASSEPTDATTKNTPASPQSTQLYQQLEANIKSLKSQYEQSRNTPQEYSAAIRYADFLKYRDIAIHDGGTHQMEAIDVYSHAIDLLEDVWRDRASAGKETRPSDDAARDGGYEGLNRDLFVDYDSKSVEGMLCAAHSNLGKVYFMSNMFERAVQSYEECLSYDGDYLDALTYRAQANVILGKYGEAGRDYKRVLEMDKDRIFPDSVTGLSKVLMAKEESAPEAGGWDFLVELIESEVPRMQNTYDQIKTSNNAGGIKHYADGLKRMHHAMFAYHDVKTKNASEAWKHLSKGNEYKLSTVAPFDDAMEKDRVRRLKQVFVPDFFPSNVGSLTRTPIFIIGFVRSGSTLLERILDAHPLIVGTGEDSVFNGRLDMIRNEIVKASMAGTPAVLGRTVKKLANDVVDDMKSRWEVIDANMNMHDGDDNDADEHSKKERPYPTRFADKMLTNYMNVGFIHLLFPNALILHVAREPMDSIFSAFKHDFPPGGLDYTSEFPGLARLYHSYRDVMEHWDKVLPGRVTHIRYEDMVTDLPNLAPKIIEAVGVPWDPTVLDFHKQKHAVNTLSTTQVRKGLYSHHFKGWKRYEDFLQPLLKLVGKRVRYDLKTSLLEADDAKPRKTPSMQPSLPTPRVIT